MYIPAGELRHQLTIERPVRTTDPKTGQAVADWEEVGTAWAKLTPRGAGERQEAGNQTTHRVTHDLLIRHTPDIGPDCRLRMEGGRVLAIAGIVNVEERNIILRIEASEVRQ